MTAIDGPGTNTAGEGRPAEPPVRRHGPVRESERIVTLDVLRGFALFGIFWVNIVFMSRPFLDYLTPIGGADATAGEVAAWAIIRTFFEYKFITLFSLLFGMGMAIQATRAAAADRPFTAIFLRRLLVLALFGLAHVVLLWYGDILFMYALLGVLLLLFVRLKAQTLLVVGGALLTGVLVLTILFGAAQVLVAAFDGRAGDPSLQATAAPAGEEPGASADRTAGPEPAEPTVEEPPPPPASPEAASEREQGAAPDTASHAAALREHPFRTVLAVLESGTGIFQDRWSDLERAGYREGPFMAAVALRLVTWGMLFLSVLLSLGWRVLGVFLIGAGLMRLGFFEARHRRWHWRCLLAGVLFGLPLEVISTGLVSGAEFGASWRWLAGESVHYVGSLVLCAGYLGGVTLLAARFPHALLVRGLANVGRLALSNYLLQTIAGTFVMQWWGLGWFGTWSRPAMIGFVIVVFLGQMALSTVWVRFFQMGPFEWLWRTITYLRPPPLVRRPG